MCKLHLVYPGPFGLTLVRDFMAFPSRRCRLLSRHWLEVTPARMRGSPGDVRVLDYHSDFACAVGARITPITRVRPRRTIIDADNAIFAAV